MACQPQRVSSSTTHTSELARLAAWCAAPRCRRPWLAELAQQSVKHQQELEGQQWTGAQCQYNTCDDALNVRDGLKGPGLHFVRSAWNLECAAYHSPEVAISRASIQAAVAGAALMS